ncbi:hypothetical protein ACX80E_06230 [Arthrobacter sp. TMN-49]
MTTEADLEPKGVIPFEKSNPSPKRNEEFVLAAHVGARHATTIVKDGKCQDGHELSRRLGIFDLEAQYWASGAGESRYGKSRIGA